MKLSQETCLFDRWGNRINIAVRKNSNNELKFIAWSKGPDSIDETEDDVIPKSYYSKLEIPYNAEKICLFKKDAG